MVANAGNQRNELLRSFPTLIMEEGTGAERAGLGWLTALNIGVRDTEFEFSIDPIFPQLTNAQIFEMAADLRMQEWEFSTNHWAIKRVDVFEVLYRRQLGAHLRPTVFQLARAPLEPSLISCMMPFSGNMDRVYQGLQTALTPMGYRCERADNIWLHDAIIQDIVHLIERSAVVVCDLSGKNANVFYETGIAHAMGKNVILLTQSPEDVPFDLRHLRYIPYLNNDEGVGVLAGQVATRVRTLSPIN